MLGSSLDFMPNRNNPITRVAASGGGGPDASKTDKLITENAQTASYTLVLADADRIVTMNNASANNLTIPLNATVAFPIGTQLIISQSGAGQTTIVPTAGVTLTSSLTAQKLANQYATATLIKLATNTWLLSGNIAT